MINKIYHYFKALFERKPESTEPIEAVFSIKGKVYYRYKDIFKVKNQRALVTNDFYNDSIEWNHCFVFGSIPGSHSHPCCHGKLLKAFLASWQLVLVYFPYCSLSDIKSCWIELNDFCCCCSWLLFHAYCITGTKLRPQCYSDRDK